MRGNIFIVKEKARWFVLFLLIVALQLLKRSQIVVIWFVDLVYVVLMMRELKHRRTFTKWWFKLKCVTQEMAILYFLTVLVIFSLLQDTSFEETTYAYYLEVSMLIAIAIAIIAELVTMISGIVDAVCTAIADHKKKKAEKEKNPDKEERTSFDLEMKKMRIKQDEGDIERTGMTPGKKGKNNKILKNLRKDGKDDEEKESTKSTSKKSGSNNAYKKVKSKNQSASIITPNKIDI